VTYYTQPVAKNVFMGPVRCRYEQDPLGLAVAVRQVHQEIWLSTGQASIPIYPDNSRRPGRQHQAQQEIDRILYMTQPRGSMDPRQILEVR